MTDPDPTVRGQELGEELRKLRDTAGMSLHDAARKIDASASKLSRLETGRRHPPVEDVAALLAIYGITGGRRGELLDLARGAERRGWWQRNRPDFTERQRTLVSLESKATRITNFEPVVVPGLLQTGEYTRAIMVESGMVDEEDLEHHMMSRMRRHSVLLRQYPPEVVALIDELVLHRVIGGKDVLRRQIEHLLQWSLRPHVTIRVIPNEKAHAGTIGPFAVIAQPSGPTVTFLENLTSSLFIETADEVEHYRRAIRTLSSCALDEQQSVQLMTEVATSLDAERTEV